MTHGETTAELTREYRAEISAQPVHRDNPTFIEVCRDIGWPEGADAVNRWNAADQAGHFSDYTDRDWTWAADQDGGEGGA